MQGEFGGWKRGLPVVAILLLVSGIVWLPGVSLAGEGGKEVAWGTLLIQLFGGLALFLYGMEKMGDALKEVAGEKMKTILGKLTTNPVMGLLTGLFVTAVIQSSSVTTVMLVGFVQADLMSLSQAIGVILGADIGTTVTAQIVAFKVTKYALLLVAAGFVMVFVGKRDDIKQYGHLIMGLGLIFFGMAVMSDAMKPLRSYDPFISLMQNVSNPLIGILISTAFTSLIQSSSATMGVVVALAMQGLITLEGGIALALGANIGTCATAALACIGKSRPAVRVAVAHITFKIVGVAIIAWFIPYLAELVRTISPAAPANLTNPQDILAAEVPRQVANAHTIFNIGIALAFLPMTELFRRFCEYVVPDREETVEEAAVAAFQPRYLDSNLLYSPPLALSMVRKETHRMGETIEEMLAGLPQALFVGNTDEMTRLREMDERVDNLYSAIARYLARISAGNLSQESAANAMSAMTVATELENIGDIIETNMSHLTQVCSSGNIRLDEESLRSLGEYHALLAKAFKACVVAYEHENQDAAKDVLEMEQELMSGINDSMRVRQSKILNTDHTVAEMAAFTLETDILQNFMRMYQHIQRVARLVLHREGSSALMVV